VSLDCLLPTGGLPLPRSYVSKLIAVLLPLGTLLPVIGVAMYMRHRWVHRASGSSERLKDCGKACGDAGRCADAVENRYNVAVMLHVALSHTCTGVL
jgi:hypothetical protein